MSDHYRFERLPGLDSPEQASTWDETLIAIGPAHPYQSSGFAACLQTLGYEPRFLRVLREGREIGRCAYLVEWGRRISCFYGPVLAHEEYATESAILQALIHHWRERGYAGLEQFQSAVPYGSGAAPVLEPPFEASETVVIDVPAAIVGGYKSMDHSVRKNVRKCKDAGVTVEMRSDPEAVDIYLEMLAGHRRRLGQRMPLLYPSLSMLAAGNRGRTRFTLALASQNGTYLSGMGYLALGEVMTEIAVAQSEEYFMRKLPAQDLIKIAALEHFAAEGVRYYDLAGVAVHPVDEKEANIRRFKLKFSDQVRAFAKTPRLAFRPAVFWPSLWLSKAKVALDARIDRASD